LAGYTYSQDRGSGVLGLSYGTVGRSYGIAGEANSPDAFGGYFYNEAVGGVGLWARSGDQATPDIVLGANGSSDDGVLASDPTQANSDIILSSQDRTVVIIGENGVANGDSYFDVRGPDSSRTFLRVHQNGKTSVRVLEINNGLDLAEQFNVQPHSNRARPAPGMVVCIDPANPGELVVCGQANSTLVAGVISGAGGVQPGMIMSQEGIVADDAQPVALAGRVYVWADASRGMIRPGDLLTTAATPGHAMKAADRDRAQGAILGKAMTGLDEGTGLVLVLVSLQ
jgi:hypothetical protein